MAAKLTKIKPGDAPAPQGGPAEKAGPSIKPPEGWKVRGPYGVMKTLDGTLLVALVDVARWLIECDGLTDLQAINRVIAPLQITDLAQMYYTNYENPLADPDGKWGQRMNQTPEDTDLAVPRPVIPPGGFTGFSLFAAPPDAPDSRLNFYKKRLFSEISYHLRRPLVDPEMIAAFYFAIPFQRAYELWGWGTVVEAQASAQADAPRVPQKMLAPELTGDKLAKRLAQLKNDKRIRAPTKVLATESGLPEREIRRRIQQKDGCQPPSPANNVFGWLNPSKKRGAR